MEFWNSLLTEKSWKLLQNLKKEYNFILIGGWATYLWTRQMKSKDIDIVVNIEELQRFKQFSLIKNDRLKKYEIKFEEIDVDIYVSHYSKLAIPAEDIRKYISNIEGFKVISREALVVLKQGAELDRRDSVKGEKDRNDIISLLFFAGLDYKIYSEILKKYSLENYIKELVYVLRSFQDYNSLNLAPRQFKLKKEKILKELRKRI